MRGLRRGLSLGVLILLSSLTLLSSHSIRKDSYAQSVLVSEKSAVTLFFHIFAGLLNKNSKSIALIRKKIAHDLHLRDSNVRCFLAGCKYVY